MTFIRVFVGKTSNQVRHVVEQDVPFRTGGNVHASDEELQAIDLGFAEDHAWKDLEGKPTSPSWHIFLRLEKDHSDMPVIHDCPCTLEGIRERLRRKGLAGIPTKARAWLANVLPPDEVDALGIGRGLPISAVMAAEARRNRRDPHGGSRMEFLRRKAQGMSNVRSARALRARWANKGGDSSA